MRGTEVYGLLGGAVSQATTKMNEIYLETYHKQVDEMFARFHSERADGSRDTQAFNDYMEVTRMKGKEIREKGLEDSQYIRYEFDKRADMNRFISYIRDESNNVPPEVIEKMAAAPVKIHGKWLMELPASVARRDADGNELLNTRGETVRFDTMSIEAGYNEKTGCTAEHYNWRNDFGDAQQPYTQETANNMIYGTFKAEMLNGLGGLGTIVRTVDRLDAYYKRDGDFDQHHALTAQTKHGKHGEDISTNWSGVRGGTKAVKVFDNGVVVMDGKDITNTPLGQRTLGLHEERSKLADSAADMGFVRRNLHWSDTNRRLQVNSQAIRESIKAQTYASGERKRGRFTSDGIDAVRNSFGEQAIMLRQSAGRAEISDDLMNALTKMQIGETVTHLSATQTEFIDSIRERRDKFGSTLDLTYADKITMVEILDKMRVETGQNSEFLSEAEETARVQADESVENGGAFRLADEDIKIFGGSFGTKKQLDAIRDDLGIDLNFERNIGRTMSETQLTHIDANLPTMLALTGAAYDEASGQFISADGTTMSLKDIKEDLKNVKANALSSIGLTHDEYSGKFYKGDTELSASEALSELSSFDIQLRGIKYNSDTGEYVREKSGKALSDDEVVSAINERLNELDDSGGSLARSIRSKAENVGYSVGKDGVFTHGADVAPMLALMGVTYDEALGSFADADGNSLNIQDIRNKLKNVKENALNNIGLTYDEGTGKFYKGNTELSTSEALNELSALGLQLKGIEYNSDTGEYYDEKSGKVLSDEEAVKAINSKLDDINNSSSLAKNLRADITREDMLKLDRAFLDKAEKAGFNFITAAGTFDVASLQALMNNPSDLKKIGISRETVEAMVRFHEGDGGMFAQLLHGGSVSWGNNQFKGLKATAAGFGKGMSVAAGNKWTGEGDAETAQFQSMLNSYKSVPKKAKQAHAYIKQFSDAVSMRIEGKKADVARKVNNNAEKATTKVKQNKAEKRQLDPNAKEKYLASQEKRVKRVSKSEKRWEKVAAARKKLDIKQRVKDKAAGTAIGKAVTKVFSAAKAFILKVIGIFLGIYMLIGGAIIAVVVIISMIQALLNLPHDLIKKAVVAISGDDRPAAMVLYHYMQDELQETWLTSISKYDDMYDDRGDLKYTITYTDFSNYMKTVNGLTEVDGDLYVNPFHDVGSNVPVENMTKIEEYDGINETQIMANPSIYGEKSMSTTGTYVSTENGHTCNIKDILAMVDVMYCFELDRFGDDEMENNILGEPVAAINFEHFWNKCAGFVHYVGDVIKHTWKSVKNAVGSFFGFGGDDDEDEFPKLSDYWGGSVSYGTIQNYCGTLFMSSHQQQVYLDVHYYEIKPIMVNIDGEETDISNRISQTNASRLGVCNSPVKSDFKIAYNGGKLSEKIFPYLLDDSGNIVDLANVDNSDLNGGLRIHSSYYGHYAGDDEDLCLWDSMTEDMTTYDKIKDMADDSDCWDLTTSKEDYTNYKTTGDWCDTEAQAKNSAYGKLWDKKTWLEENPPTVAKEFTLTADHNGFTRIWKEVCWHDEHQYGATEHDKVADGTETAYYYWDGGDKGAGNFGGSYLPLRDEDAGGRRVYYEVRVYEKYSDGSLSSSYDTIYADDTSEASWGGDDGRTLTVTRYNEEDAVHTYDADKNYTAQWYCPTTELTHYKDVYRCTWTGDLVVQKTEIYNRNCDGHEFEYCGGHVGCHSKGVVYSVTNEQMTLAGMYENEDIAPLARDFDLLEHGYKDIEGKVITDKVDYEGGAKAASLSGGCPSPLEDIQGSDVNRGLNLYIGDDDALGKDINPRNDVPSQVLRDIFDVDCMLDKGSNIFPWKAVSKGGKGYKEYEGWTADNITYVAMRITNDWNDLYGFDIALEIGAIPLSEDDIKVITDGLAMEYGIHYTETRAEAVDFALHWISRGHYSTEHKDHDFLHSACKAHTIATTYNGTTYTVSYDACCTASNAKGFVNFYLQEFGKGKINDVYSDSEWNTLTNLASLSPADIYFRKRDTGYEGYCEYELPEEFLPEWNESSCSWIPVYEETHIGDTITDAICDMRDSDTYGIYIGKLTKLFEDDSYEFPEGIKKEGDVIILTNGYKIYKGLPITVDLAQEPRVGHFMSVTNNSGAGTVYLRTGASENYGMTAVTENYYWLLHPDSRVKYRKFE